MNQGQIHEECSQRTLQQPSELHDGKQGLNDQLMMAPEILRRLPSPAIDSEHGLLSSGSFSSVNPAKLFTAECLVAMYVPK